MLPLNQMMNLNGLWSPSRRNVQCSQTPLSLPEASQGTESVINRAACSFCRSNDDNVINSNNKKEESPTQYQQLFSVRTVSVYISINNFFEEWMLELQYYLYVYVPLSICHYTARNCRMLLANNQLTVLLLLSMQSKQKFHD